MSELPEGKNAPGTSESSWKRKSRCRGASVSQSQCWSLAEKTKLLGLLYWYPLSAYDNFALHIKTKSAKEIESFIKKFVKSAENTTEFRTDSEHRAPLEEWKEVAADLLYKEPVDCSANLSKVFSIIAAFEDLPQEEDGPDYRAIYRFLSQCMLNDKSEDLEQLGALESAVVLDLLHNLMSLLGQRDTDVQKNVMKWKYMLLNCDSKECKHNRDKRMRRARENDFRTFIADLYHQESKANDAQQVHERYPGLSNRVKMYIPPNNDHSSSETLTNCSNDSEGQTSCEIQQPVTVTSTIVSPATSTTNQSNSVSSSTQSTVSSTQSQSSSTQEDPVHYLVEINKDYDQPQETSLNSEQVTTENSIKMEQAPRTVTSFIDNPIANTQQIQRHKRGRKGYMDLPETPMTEIVLVMPPDGAKITNYSARSKKAPVTGRFQPINQDEELITNDLNRDFFYEVQKSQYNASDKNERGKNRNGEKEGMTTAVHKGIKESHKRMYDYLNESVKDTNVPVKKPKLFTLNPFCLPVKLIDLDAIQDGNV